LEAPVRLLVVGDFGRCGEFMGTSAKPRQASAEKQVDCENQTRLATALAAVAQSHRAQAVLNVGDSFYKDGLPSVHDDTFKGSFVDVYDRELFPSLDIPWHSIMGNHDHRSKNISCYFDPELRTRDPRWHAYFEGSIVFPSPEDPILEVVMLDTTPFAEKYLNEAGAKPGDKRKHPFQEQRKRGATPADPASRRKELQAALGRLEQRLSAAKQRGVRWLVVMGHNPIRDSGDHGDDPSLVALLDPLLWKYGVHAYLNGHDHHMEHAHWPRCCEFRRGPPVPAGGPVVINEALDDTSGEWVELYNGGEVVVSLAGWVLRTESMYADVALGEDLLLLGPGEFRRIEMKLKDGNEHVSLLNVFGEVVSELAWGSGEMINAFSLGRHPDGSSEPAVAMKPSPGSSNHAPLPTRPGAPVGAPPAMNASGWLPTAPARADISEWSVHYFTVGNAGGLGHHDVAAKGEPSYTEFFQRANGFMALHASRNELVFKLVDDRREVVHEVRLDGPSDA